MKKYRVLILDDKKAVIDSIKDRIERTYNVGNETYKIHLSCLEVDVSEINGNYQFSDKTILDLYDLCEKPFDLFLLDFGYVKKGLKTVDEIFRLKENFPERSIREIIDNIVLNPSHLIKQCYENPKYLRKIEKNFIEHKGSLYLYTYIPNKLERDYTSVDVRRHITNEHFPKATIKVMDTRKELFNNNQFDNKYDKEYYPFLISKFLSKTIQNEILKKVITQTETLREKFQQIRKNNRLKLLTTILLSILTGVLIPTIIDSIKSGNISTILIFTITIVLTVSFLTLIIFNLETKNNRLLK